jgi:hypothetical protein
MKLRLSDLNAPADEALDHRNMRPMPQGARPWPDNRASLRRRVLRTASTHAAKKSVKVSLAGRVRP